MKRDDDEYSSTFSTADPPKDSGSIESSSDQFSLFEGEIEKSTLRYDRQGQALLTISGWLICPEMEMIALQFAIPGSELSLARRVDRPEKAMEFPDCKDAFKCGFMAVLSFKERSTILDEVHFISTLAHGLTVAGALSLPETFIQNSADQFFPEPDEPTDSRKTWGPRLDEDSRAQLNPPQNTTANTNTPEKSPANKKELLKEISQINATHRLKSFLSLENKLVFDTPPEPLTSILVILHNKAEYTLDCLQSLLQSTTKDFELILVDNASTDETSALLEKVEGATIISNSENLHFVKAVNENLSTCRGKYLLLLNNDTQITPSAIEHAVNTFSYDKLTAAVGGRIIRADGLLQEAGCSIISNGGCYGYGVGLNPWDPRFLFTREVDFCSGTFLMLRKDLFEAAGGFDVRFEPAYFEEVDLQLRFSKAGYKTLYNPKIVVFHAEHGSSSTLEASKQQAKQREVFKEIHKEDLTLYPNTLESVLRAGRAIFDKRKRILILDDDIPADHFGTGLPRTKAIIKGLNDLRLDVTYYPLKETKLPWYEITKHFPEKTEVISNWGEEQLLKFIIERQKFFDYIWISRPHNLETWKRVTQGKGIKLSAKLIYDAESLFAERELDKLILTTGEALNKEKRDYVKNSEIELFSEFEQIIMVSERDKENLKKQSQIDSKVLSMPIKTSPTPNSFSDRKDILFVGPLTDPNSANVHGLKWFINCVLPIISNSLPSCTTLNIVGNVNKSLFTDCNPESLPIKFHGPVETLEPYYNEAKVVIIPTHFSAGISLKTLFGAAHGVPIASTSRIANELMWSNGIDLLSGDSPFMFASQIINLFSDQTLWTTLRENALKKVESSYNYNDFLKTLSSILQ